MPVEQKHITRFFLALCGAGGEMNRTRLSVRVFRRNWDSAGLNDLVAAAVQTGYVEVKPNRTVKAGRVSARYVLTPKGWDVARLWALPRKVDSINPEEVERQFVRLAEEGNPWASGLTRDAKAWQSHLVAEGVRKEAEAAAKAERSRIWREAHPQPKHPSKGRHRSPKDIADRRAWAERTWGNKSGAGEPVTSTPSLPSLNEGAFRPYQPQSPFVQPPRSPFGVTPDVMPRPIAQPSGSADLLEKIRKAGYQVRMDTNQVMYGLRWISPQEWLKLMPGIVD